MRYFVKVAALAPLLAIFAACSSSSGAGSGVSGSSPGTKASNAIRLMLIGPELYTKDSVLGAEAAADDVNAHGGVKGRPIEIDTCFDNLDANKSADCARKAVADPSTLAFVGNVTSFGDSVDPIAERAGMASIAAALVSAADFSSPNVFPTHGGRPLTVISTATLCTNVLGAKQIGTAYADIPGASNAAAQAQGITKSRGLPDPKSVAIPLAAADLSPQVAAVAKSDCILAMMPVDLMSRFIKTARQQGVNSPIVAPATLYSPRMLDKQLGANIKNVYIAEVFDTFSEGYKEMQAAVAKFRGNDAVRDLTASSASAWLGVHMFADVANKTEGSLTRQAVLDGLHHLSGYDTKGLTTAPLDYTVKATAMGGQIPNLRPSVTGIWPLQYLNGKLVPVKGGHDLKVFG